MVFYLWSKWAGYVLFDLEYRIVGQTCLPAIYQDFYPPVPTNESACLVSDLTKIIDKYGSISVLGVFLWIEDGYLIH